MQPEPEAPADVTVHARLRPEQDLQQSLQYDHFRRERENTERAAACTLNLTTHNTAPGNTQLQPGHRYLPRNTMHVRQNQYNFRDRTESQTRLGD